MKPWHGSRIRLWGTAFCAITALFACTDIRDVSSPRATRPARLAFAPRYALLAGASVGSPINRIRLTAREQATGSVVGTLITDVDPSADAWDLGLDVSLESQIVVIVTIELINVAAGVETVQWSGVTDPITVAPTQGSPTAAPG